MTEAPSKRRAALITGASSGIGLAFAHEFARGGFDVVLTARRARRLEEAASALAARYGVSAHPIPADLAQGASCEALFQETARRGLVIDALVNNAGYGVPGRFEDIPWTAHRDFLEVLVASLCHLTHLALPGMRARGYGRIVNVASIAGFAPAAIGAILYPAAKAFVIRFSQSLALENRGAGIHVTALCPGFTRSEFHDAKGTRRDVARLPAFMWMEAETVARQGFNAVMRGDVLCVNGRLNRLIVSLARHTPNRLALWATRRIMSP